MIGSDCSANDSGLWADMVIFTIYSRENEISLLSLDVLRMWCFSIKSSGDLLNDDDSLDFFLRGMSNQKSREMSRRGQKNSG